MRTAEGAPAEEDGKDPSAGGIQVTARLSGNAVEAFRLELGRLARRYGITVRTFDARRVEDEAPTVSPAE